jgi:hypothetical protein
VIIMSHQGITVSLNWLGTLPMISTARAFLCFRFPCSPHLQGSDTASVIMLWEKTNKLDVEGMEDHIRSSSHEIHTAYDIQTVADANCISSHRNKVLMAYRSLNALVDRNSAWRVSLSRQPSSFIKVASLHPCVIFMLYCRNDKSYECGSWYIRSQTTSAYVTAFKSPLYDELPEIVSLLQVLRTIVIEYLAIFKKIVWNGLINDIL